MIPGKIPFTGYFDPILQRYTIENFDQNTFQTREEVEPTIVMTDRPDYLKRLDAIPFSSDPNKREEEIRKICCRKFTRDICIPPEP